jgi:hypothetical protein
MGASLMSLYRTDDLTLMKPTIDLKSKSRWLVYAVNAQSFAEPGYGHHCGHVVDNEKAMFSLSFLACGRVCCAIIEPGADGFHVLLVASKT